MDSLAAVVRVSVRLEMSAFVSSHSVDRTARRTPARSGAVVDSEEIMRLAERMQRLGTETAFDVLVRARALEAQGRDVVHLELGEPDFDSPAPVIAAGQAALAAGDTHYGPAVGLPELRRA